MRMRTDPASATVSLSDPEGRTIVKLPKIKTLNHQIDVIEEKTTTSEMRLAKMEGLLERIAQRLDTRQASGTPSVEDHPPGL
jgi:C4-type Zn-finger protein